MNSNNLALFLYLSHERTQLVITFQHYHVTQRLVGTYSVGTKTKSVSIFSGVSDLQGSKFSH